MTQHKHGCSTYQGTSYRCHFCIMRGENIYRSDFHVINPGRTTRGGVETFATMKHIIYAFFNNL